MTRKIDSMKEIQKIELEILDYIVQVCIEHNLRYYLVGGTLLGAVRHKGFIPWDDDMDIAMPREDYEEFEGIMMQNQNNSYYKLYSPKIGSCYPIPFNKVVDSRTIINTKIVYPQTVGEGLSVDIFPMDGMGDDLKLAQKIMNHIPKRYSAFIQIGSPLIGVEKQQLFKILIKKMILIPFKIIGREKMLHFENDRLKKYNFDSSRYVASTFGMRKEKEIIDRSCFESIEVEFEGKTYKAPIGYDQYLKQMYGDYMKLPPVEQRVTCHEFQTYWKEDSNK